MFSKLFNGVTRKLDTLADSVNNEIADLRNIGETFSKNINVLASGDFSRIAGGPLSRSATGSTSASANAYSPSPGPLNDPVPPSAFIPGTTPPPWPNELSDFSTMNVNLEFAVLSAEEINDPDGTYRKNGPKNVVIRNGGIGSETKVRTAYESALGKDVEFFLDDIEWTSLINETGNTNAQKFAFTVLEPYSMGLFLQALQLAATSSGYKDYIGAPVLLTIDFLGYDENNNSGRAPYARRMIPVRFTSVTFETNEAGTTYSCEALAWNDIALMDLVQSVNTDLTISGTTVQEILQSGIESLAASLTQREIDQQAAGIKSTGDQFVVMFPTTKSSADTNPVTASGNTGGGSATIDPYQITGSQRRDLLEYYNSIRGERNAERLQNAPPGLQRERIAEQIAAEEAEYQAALNPDAGDPRRGTGYPPGIGPRPVVPVPPGFDSYVSEFETRIAQQSQIGQRIREFAESAPQTSAIGKGKIVQSFVESGNHPFARDGYTLDPETQVYSRNGVELQLSGDLRTFTFKAGSRIQDIITEVVIVSEFGQSLIERLNNLEEDGMLEWFKIETQVYSIPDNNEVDRSGKTPSVFVFRVVPYKVHSSIFQAPTAAGAGYGTLKTEAAKQYNYIYTGFNQDILDFQIKYDKQFYTVQRADGGNLSAGTRVGAANAMVQDNPEPTNTTGGVPNPGVPEEGVAETQQTTSVAESSGGSGYDNSAIGVARMFQEQFNNSDVDLAKCELQIIGDPFYISDSGLGNFNAGDTSYSNMNNNGSMNYQNGEVDINLIFRTPIDYNEAGGMDFPEDSKIVSPFSGLYRVTKVKNNISSNTFTQTLSLLRRRNQTEGGVSQGNGAFVQGDVSQSLNDALVSLQKAGDNLNPIDPATVAAAQAKLAEALPIIQEVTSNVGAATDALNSGVLGQLREATNAITGQFNDALTNATSLNINSALDQATATATSALASAQSELSNIGSQVQNIANQIPDPNDIRLQGPF